MPDAPVPTVLVLDNGVGISPKRVQHLFRELGRAHGYRDEGLADEGLGLGLSIVRECMDASGGTVRLESDGRPRDDGHAHVGAVTGTEGPAFRLALYKGCPKADPSTACCSLMPHSFILFSSVL